MTNFYNLHFYTPTSPTEAALSLTQLVTDPANRDSRLVSTVCGYKTTTTPITTATTTHHLHLHSPTKAALSLTQLVTDSRLVSTVCGYKTTTTTTTTATTTHHHHHPPHPAIHPYPHLNPRTKAALSLTELVTDSRLVSTVCGYKTTTTTTATTTHHHHHPPHPAIHPYPHLNPRTKAALSLTELVTDSRLVSTVCGYKTTTTTTTTATTTHHHHHPPHPAIHPYPHLNPRTKAALSLTELVTDSRLVSTVCGYKTTTTTTTTATTTHHLHLHPPTKAALSLTQLVTDPAHGDSRQVSTVSTTTTTTTTTATTTTTTTIHPTPPSTPTPTSTHGLRRHCH